MQYDQFIWFYPDLFTFLACRPNWNILRLYGIILIFLRYSGSGHNFKQPSFFRKSSFKTAGLKPSLFILKLIVFNCSSLHMSVAGEKRQNWENSSIFQKEKREYLYCICSDAGLKSTVVNRTCTPNFTNGEILGIMVTVHFTTNHCCNHLTWITQVQEWGIGKGCG